MVITHTQQLLILTATLLWHNRSLQIEYIVNCCAKFRQKLDIRKYVDLITSQT